MPLVTNAGTLYGEVINIVRPTVDDVFSVSSSQLQNYTSNNSYYLHASDSILLIGNSSAFTDFREFSYSGATSGLTLIDFVSTTAYNYYLFRYINSQGKISTLVVQQNPDNTIRRICKIDSTLLVNVGNGDYYPGGIVAAEDGLSCVIAVSSFDISSGNQFFEVIALDSNLNSYSTVRYGYSSIQNPSGSASFHKFRIRYNSSNNYALLIIGQNDITGRYFYSKLAFTSSNLITTGDGAEISSNPGASISASTYADSFDIDNSFRVHAAVSLLNTSTDRYVVRYVNFTSGTEIDFYNLNQSSNVLYSSAIGVGTDANSIGMHLYNGNLASHEYVAFNPNNSNISEEVATTSTVYPDFQSKLLNTYNFFSVANSYGSYSFNTLFSSSSFTRGFKFRLNRVDTSKIYEVSSSSVRTIDNFYSSPGDVIPVDWKIQSQIGIADPIYIGGSFNQSSVFEGNIAEFVPYSDFNAGPVVGTFSLQTAVTPAVTGRHGMTFVRGRGSNTTSVIDTKTLEYYRSQLYFSVLGLTSSSSSFSLYNNEKALFANYGLFQWGDSSSILNGSSTGISHIFKEAPAFYSTSTWTGNGTPQAITHGLGISPGMIIIKAVTTTGSWFVYHKDSGLTNTSNAWTNYLALDSAAQYTQEASNAGIQNISAASFTPTSTALIQNGIQYVAYVFANDSDANSIIKCGSFTTDAGGAATINLGFEPQFVLTKGDTVSSDFVISDTMRGTPLNIASYDVSLTQATAETTSGILRGTLPTGFKVQGSASQKYVYVAVRKSNKDAASLSTLHTVDTYQGTGATTQVTIGQTKPDLVLIANKATNANKFMTIDRVRGNPYLVTNSTNGTALPTTNTAFIPTQPFDLTNLLDVGTNAAVNGSGVNYIARTFRQAKGYFDIVSYTGTGAVQNVTHNLGVVPEFIITKRLTGATANWLTYHTGLGNTQAINFNLNGAPTTDATYWNSTTPTASVVTLGSSTAVNTSGATYIMYLFASVPGKSKVFSYTGNGTTFSQTLGFTPKTVIIKRTSAAGSWLIWDTFASPGNDTYKAIDSTAAQVTNNDSIDIDGTLASINIKQNATSNVNVSAATYIGIAFA